MAPPCSSSLSCRSSSSFVSSAFCFSAWRGGEKERKRGREEEKRGAEEKRREEDQWRVTKAVLYSWTLIILMHSHTFSLCYSLFCEVPFHSPSLPPVPQCAPGALGSSCSMQPPLTGLPPPAVADQLSHGPCCRRGGEGGRANWLRSRYLKFYRYFKTINQLIN